MQHFVRIINRGTYTKPRKALKYVSRGLAAVVDCTPAGIITEIRMLESAELSMARSIAKRERITDPVTGKFEWSVRDSGAPTLMKRYEGLGGMRVLQARHGN